MSMKAKLSSAARLAVGCVQHYATGKTPPHSYQAMIQLFCETGGISNDAMSSAISLVRRPYRLPDSNGVLGNLGESDVTSIADDIRLNGYHLFDRKLPSDLCDRLVAFAQQTPCLARAMDSNLGTDQRLERFPREAPKVVRYDLDGSRVVNNEDVQGLLADNSILAVAQSYLGSAPIADVTGMWWNTASSSAPDKQAAQFWHFDMDRVKWLKFFIYLTDVGPENGPHSFVEGSHRRGGIPPELLSKGYMRLTDEEVDAHYERNRQIEFTAPRGTILAEDTRGLHKGRNLIRGDRLMLQLQFSNSLFGGYYSPTPFTRPAEPVLEGMIKRFPRIYSNFT